MQAVIQRTGAMRVTVRLDRKRIAVPVDLILPSASRRQIAEVITVSMPIMVIGATGASKPTTGIMVTMVNTPIMVIGATAASKPTTGIMVTTGKWRDITVTAATGLKPIMVITATALRITSVSRASAMVITGRKGTAGMAAVDMDTAVMNVADSIVRRLTCRGERSPQTS
jgi:hypothetical protein